MKKNIILGLLLTVFSYCSYGQMTISTGVLTPTQYVNNLVGPGISVSNVTFNGSTSNATMVRDQVGHFLNGSATNIGINNGLILSTGKATGAIGPNNSGSTTLTTLYPMSGDSDLAAITSGTINTKAIIENDNMNYIIRLEHEIQIKDYRELIINIKKYNN